MLDDRTSTLLHLRNEFTAEPFMIINDIKNRFAVNFAKTDIRIHSRRMITPNACALDACRVNSRLARDLENETVVVEPRESGEILRRDIFALGHRDERVCISRVADNYSTARFLGRTV